MRVRVAYRVIVLAVVAGGVAAFVRRPASAPAQSQGSSVQRGRYLVVAGGCHDCHSPKVFSRQGPVPDTTRLLSGFPANQPVPTVPANVIGPNAWGALATNDLTAWAGPWGVSFGANLTPDGTGLGGWSDTMFIRAIRTGKHMGVGRPILPPMPWPDFAQLTDDDLRSIFMYLRSLRPVQNVVPPPIPPAGSGGGAKPGR